MAVWEVVGGGDKGGIIVRAGQDTQSAALDRISTGALLLQLALEGDRLQYEKLSGTGPQTGWVALKLKDKDLCVPSNKKVITLQFMSPLSREAEHVCDLHALEDSTVGSVKASCCRKFPSLKPTKMMPIKVKKGEREEGRTGESPKLNETDVLKDVGLETGDEFAFIYMGDIEADFPLPGA